MRIPRTLLRLLLATALGLSLALDAGAGESAIDFFVADDLGIKAPVDDLYTAALGAAGSTHGYRFALYENLFTDEPAGLRFDETHLTVSRPVEVSAWVLTPEVGGVRVGEGLFGQSFQNFVHRLIGRDELDLSYVDGTDLFLSLRFEALRPFHVSDRLEFGPRIELYDAFNLKSHAILGGAFDWQASRRFALFGYVAARYSAADFAPLEPWMRGWAPAGEIGVRYRQRVAAVLSYNAFGTEDDHLHVRFGWRFD
jgi:hypothetical protein